MRNGNGLFRFVVFFLFVSHFIHPESLLVLSLLYAVLVNNFFSPPLQ